MKINDIFFENEYSNAFDYVTKNNLNIIEIEPIENKRRFQIIKSEFNKDTKETRIFELQNLLNKTDYIVTKLAEMQITNNENFSSELARYQSTIQNRVAWRSELDRLLNE